MTAQPGLGPAPVRRPTASQQYRDSHVLILRSRRLQVLRHTFGRRRLLQGPQISHCVLLICIIVYPPYFRRNHGGSCDLRKFPCGTNFKFTEKGYVSK
jgi:hypothetical protein